MLLPRGADLRNLHCPQILTGAPNREGREDKTYKLRRVANSVLS